LIVNDMLNSHSDEKRKVDAVNIKRLFFADKIYKLDLSASDRVLNIIKYIININSENKKSISDSIVQVFKKEESKDENVWKVNVLQRTMFSYLHKLNNISDRLDKDDHMKQMISYNSRCLLTLVKDINTIFQEDATLPEDESFKRMLNSLFVPI